MFYYVRIIDTITKIITKPNRLTIKNKSHQKAVQILILFFNFLKNKRTQNYKKEYDSGRRKLAEWE